MEISKKQMILPSNHLRIQFYYRSHLFSCLVKGRNSGYFANELTMNMDFVNFILLTYFMMRFL
jgi:hypothetical protein